MKKSLLTACALLSLCLPAGCASKPKEEPKTAEGLYVQAKEYMDKTSYAKSAETFEK